MEWLPVGRFRLGAPERTGDSLSVSGQGLLVNVERARLLAPWKAPKGITRARALSRLLTGILPWRTVGLVDEVLPAFLCERERLEGVREIVEGWPARLEMSDTGVLLVRKPWSDDDPGRPVVEFVDGPGGTLVSCSVAPDTSSQFNGYSVSTQPEGDEQPITEAWGLPAGPMRWTGPYGQFPGFYSSPTLPADRVRLRTVAQTLTQRAQRRRDAYEVVAAPDPRVHVGDVCRVRSGLLGIDIVGRVTRLALTRSSLTATVAYLSGSRP